MAIKSDVRGFDNLFSILFSLIIGLIILGIVFFWIYQDYFTQDDVNYQVCKQSVEARHNIPDPTIFTQKIWTFKQEFPLKCKTEVITIDYEDLNRLEREIANTIAGCWNLYGEGKKDFFPSNIFTRASICVPCARIHISPKVRPYYLENEVVIPRALNLAFKDTTYIDYLNKGDGPFPAFIPGGSVVNQFNLNGEKFKVNPEEKKPANFVNRITEVTEKAPSISMVDLPRSFDVNKGDLLIFYSHVVFRSDRGIGSYFPYLFYTHSRDNYLAEFDKMFVDGWFGSINFCEQQDGIPA